MKSWYLSRTLWVNLLAAVAVFVQAQYGYIISPEIQAYVLVALNAFLRVATKDELTA